MESKSENFFSKLIKREFLNYYEIFLYLLAAICFLYFLIQGNISKTLQPLLIVSVLMGYRAILKFTDINLHGMIKLSLLIFIFMAMFLADEFDFYTKIPIYDKILHSLSGILFFFVGLSIFKYISKGDIYINSHNLVVVSFGLLFSLATAGCWEIFEFTVDRLFGMNTQNGSLFDTMGDMICATVCAIPTSIYWFLRLSKSPSEAEPDYGVQSNFQHYLGDIILEKERVS